MTRALIYSPFKYYFGVFAPLLFCSFIALFYRPTGTLAQEIFHIHRSFHWLKNDVIIYSLPAGLWVFSLTLISFSIKKYRFLFSIAPLFFVVGLEFLQFFHVTDGTFDLYDIFVPLTCYFIAYMLYLLNMKYFAIKSSSLWHHFVYVGFFISVCLADIIH